ncbi:MAG: hypothetical protein HY074_01790 [Deltaproteobacteria bacterium]|nr:hypothetical protein [Deltaproteobacteria bacterium]
MAQITISRSKLLAGVAVLCSVGLGLVCSEIMVRLHFTPPRTEPIRLDDSRGNVGALCFPRMSGASLPLDLNRPEDQAKFLNLVDRIHANVPESVLGKGELERLLEDVAAREMVSALAQEVPLCVTYDLRALELSPRFLVAPAGFKDTIALLGDSFVFGHGLTDADTFTAKLAEKMHVRVRSYADAGANLAEIRGQFSQALADAKRFKFSKIVYVYVPNDPYMTTELAERLSGLNDLMIVRLQGTLSTPRPLSWLIGWVEERSALARAFAFQVSTRFTAGQTVAWYRDIHDPEKNPRLIESIEAISRMSNAARQRGIDFIVMVYPLMLDMDHYPLIEAHRTLGHLAKSWSIELYDLLPVFQREHGGTTLFVHPLDLHPSAYAQTIAATAAAAYLKKR